MFGNRGELGRLVASQQSEIEALKQKNADLESMQLDGPAAAIAQDIDQTIQQWIGRGFVIDDETGIPVQTHETAYSLAVRRATMQHASAVFKDAQPERQLELVKQVLEPHVITDIAAASLRHVLLNRPALISGIMSDARITEVVTSLTRDEEVRQQLLESLLPKPEAATHTFKDLQQELYEFGHFSTDKLVHGKTITLDVEFVDDRGYTCIGSHIARTVLTSDNESWLSLIRVHEPKGSAQNTKYVIAQPQHTLFRIGHQNGEGIFEPKAVPGASWSPLYKSEVIDNYMVKKSVVIGFRIDGQKLKFP